jgi:hypothetical protein
MKRRKERKEKGSHYHYIKMAFINGHPTLARKTESSAPRSVEAAFKGKHFSILVLH